VKVVIMKECGFHEAMMGLGLSYDLTTGMNNLSVDILDRVYRASLKLCHKDGGHNKFLESIIVWLKIDAPLYWFSQLDTYRIGSKQSTSTMHTLLKKPIVQEMFDQEIPVEFLSYLEKLRQQKEFIKLRGLLPSSFIQTRLCCYSYKTLRNIYKQRVGHKLPEWNIFCNYLINNLEHSEYINSLK
jgi:hypothetical protein